MKNIQVYLKRFKDERTALYFFTKTIDCCNAWARPIGLSIFDEDYKPINFRIIFTNVWNIIFIIFNINSVIARKNEDLIEISLSCITIGMAFQGLIKQYTFFKNSKEINELVYSGVTLYNILQHDKIKKNARDFAFIGWFVIMHFLRYAYTLATTSCILIPVIYSNFFGDKPILPFEVEIPFTNKNEVKGYWINVLYLCISAVFENIGLVASDGIYLILLLNGFTQLENIFFELENLDEFIKHSDSTKIREQLTNIIKLHQKYISYIRRINDIFFMYFTVNVVTMVYQIVICLFIIVTVNTKISAPILVFTGTSQLLLCCIVGTILETKHDRLIRCTYDICWYDMEISEQKKMKLLLQVAQEDVYIEYLFGALNLPLFLEIYKKIYSGLTMLVNSQQRHE